MILRKALAMGVLRRSALAAAALVIHLSMGSASFAGTGCDTGDCACYATACDNFCGGPGSGVSGCTHTGTTCTCN